MVSCRDVEPQLSLLIDGLLSADEESRVRTHVSGCHSCRGLLADLERLRVVTRQMGPIAPPEHVWLEVAGQIRLTHPSAPVASSSGRPALQWIGLAAALVLVTVGVYFFQRTKAIEAPGVVTTARQPVRGLAAED
jgi:anti-sigma factor RsiW